MEQLSIVRGDAIFFHSDISLSRWSIEQLAGIRAMDVSSLTRRFVISIRSATYGDAAILAKVSYRPAADEFVAAAGRFAFRIVIRLRHHHAIGSIIGRRWHHHRHGLADNLSGAFHFYRPIRNRRLLLAVPKPHQQSLFLKS